MHRLFGNNVTVKYILTRISISKLNKIVLPTGLSSMFWHVIFEYFRVCFIFKIVIRLVENNGRYLQFDIRQHVWTELISLHRISVCESVMVSWPYFWLSVLTSWDDSSRLLHNLLVRHWSLVEFIERKITQNRQFMSAFGSRECIALVRVSSPICFTQYEMIRGLLASLQSRIHVTVVINTLQLQDNSQLP